jgi:hypothetical protein
MHLLHELCVLFSIFELLSQNFPHGWSLVIGCDHSWANVTFFALRCSALEFWVGRALFDNRVVTRVEIAKAPLANSVVTFHIQGIHILQTILAGAPIEANAQAPQGNPKGTQRKSNHNFCNWRWGLAAVGGGVGGWLAVPSGVLGWMLVEGVVAGAALRGGGWVVGIGWWGGGWWGVRVNTSGVANILAPTGSTNDILDAIYVQVTF